MAWLWHRRSQSAPPSDGVAIFGLVWLSYALGAVLGALGNAFLTYPLLMPAAGLPFIYARFWRLLRR